MIVRSIHVSSLSLLYVMKRYLVFFHDKSTVELNVRLQPAVLNDCGVINPRHCVTVLSLLSFVVGFQLYKPNVKHSVDPDRADRTASTNTLHPHGMTSISIPGLESVDSPDSSHTGIASPRAVTATDAENLLVWTLTRELELGAVNLIPNRMIRTTLTSLTACSKLFLICCSRQLTFILLTSHKHEKIPLSSHLPCSRPCQYPGLSRVYILQ